MPYVYVAEEAAASSTAVPGFVFGAIAFGVFLVLAYVTWTYRDVANRHDHKSGKGSH
jgi:cytochrome bd-type quinol oxidase subunit 2